MYDRDAITPFPYQLPENAPVPMRAMRDIRHGLEIPERNLREVQAVYYGMVTKVEGLIGRVLEAIEAEGLFENSIVMFWVDHGDFAAQYGLPEKWDTCMADCLMHVPCILHAPGLPAGISVESLTEHTDLAPTILELLDIEPGWGIHGESLIPAIEGRHCKGAVFADGGHEEEMRERFVREWGERHGPHETQRGGKQDVYARCPDSMARTKMVRTKRWKLVIRETGGNELYDMEADPYELRNLWGRPESASVTSALLQSIVQWDLRTDTDRPIQQRVCA
jgi:choline-sulfatase